MAHPFFGAFKFPFHRAEGAALLNALADAIAAPSQINWMYEKCGAGLTPLFLGQAHDLVWVEALRNLAAAGALRKLLDQIEVRFPDSPTWQKVVRDIANAQPAVDAKIVSDDVLVLDRSTLRQQITLLETDKNIKVLLVRGNPRTGKTWSQQIFNRVASDNGARSLYLYQGIIFTVDDVVEQLFSLFPTEQTPARDTTDEAWYQKVCTRLQRAASSTGEQVWIAVDDLGIDEDGAQILDKNILEFCNQFALNMEI